MPITPKEIRKLKGIYYHEYNVELSDRQAWAMASNLLEYVQLLLEIAEESRKNQNGDSPVLRN